MNNSLRLGGRILFAIPMLMFAMGHFMNADSMSGMTIPDWPASVAIVYLTGITLVAAAVAIVIKKKASLAALLLAIQLLLTALVVWMPAMMSGNEEMAMMGQTNFFKDLGLTGAALFMSGVFGQEEKA